MAEIFISYRRDDQAGFAGRLADALGDAFGTDNVFRDVEDIRPGEDFIVAIQKQLSTVDVVLVLIGPAWLTVSRNGVRRLDEPDDFVRLEIQAGLDSGQPVIPVLVGGASMPGEADLPLSLAGLARRQAVMLSDKGWHGDVARLVKDLRDMLPGKSGEKPKIRPAGLMLAGMAVVVLVAVFAAPRFVLEKNPATNAGQPALPSVEVAGRWTAQVNYDWGDKYDEVFEFKYLGTHLHGTASYLSGPLTIEQATLEDGWLRFITRSQEVIGNDGAWKEVTNRYIGQLTPQGIRFTLESGGGYTIHPPVEFVAERAKP